MGNYVQQMFVIFEDFLCFSMTFFHYFFSLVLLSSKYDHIV